MRLPQNASLHLAYCQNIHPGETWEEHYGALESQAVAVRNALGATQPFGLGLRISATAAAELQSPEAIRKGLSLFESQNLYPFTINGFPYGKFHRGPVKTNVYAPDWRNPQRLSYTLDLARILAEWLPEGGEGSISTVPGSYGAWIHTKEDELEMARQLGAVAAEFARIEANFGRRLHLGLEPEPDCFLETTDQTLAFFQGSLEEGAVPEIRKITQCSHDQAIGFLKRHVGVCFDTCHVALQYEEPAKALQSYRKADILISKIQISAALRSPSSKEGLEALSSFREPVYLHQVKGLGSDRIIHSWPDLPEALSEIPSTQGIDELRVHFHVPLFVAPAYPLSSTADTLNESFWEEVQSGVCPHLEIETYTFDVLPKEVHPGDIIESIVREYHWVLEKLHTEKPKAL
jgi:hypothetical protein